MELQLWILSGKHGMYGIVISNRISLGKLCNQYSRKKILKIQFRNTYRHQISCLILRRRLGQRDLFIIQLQLNFLCFGTLKNKVKFDLKKNKIKLAISDSYNPHQLSHGDPYVSHSFTISASH